MRGGRGSRARSSQSSDPAQGGAAPGGDVAAGRARRPTHSLALARLSTFERKQRHKQEKPPPTKSWHRIRCCLVTPSCALPCCPIPRLVSTLLEVIELCTADLGAHTLHTPKFKNKGQERVGGPRPSVHAIVKPCVFVHLKVKLSKTSARGCLPPSHHLRRAQRAARGARRAQREERACRPFDRASARSSLADRGARGASRRARPSRRARADDDARPGPFFFGSPRSCDRNASVWFSCSDFWTCDFQVWVSVTDRHTDRQIKGVRVGVPTINEVEWGLQN